MTLTTWLAFCATETVLCFIPGPAVVFVVSVALARGARSGMAATLGILSANAFYFALSGTGVAAAIVASGHLFAALRWLGAGYLVWMGFHMLWWPQRQPAGATTPDARRSLIRGIVVQGANPKALVFFIALLPQFINPAAAVAPQVLVLGISSVLIELLVLTLYVAAAVRARRFAGARFASSLERAGGGFLVAAGVRLAFVGSE
jgi:homoserine/homoserine lactone efflux protein